MASRDNARSWATAPVSEDVFRVLAEGASPSEVWSLLLEIMARRASARTLGDLTRQWQRDGFTRPAYIDQRTLVELDGHLLAAADRFEAIELSPLAPLGCCSIVGLASQHKIVSALRGTEVVADPTNIFALECARRLRSDPTQTVRLATSHRCVRAQEIPKQPGFAQHFRIFCLATAGRERQNHAFVFEALLEQITTYRAALDRLEQHGYAFPDRTVTILSTAERDAVADRLAAAVSGVPVKRAPLEHQYYNGGLRFMIGARSTLGTAVPLIDGGAFNWVAKLANNHRFAFVASGMGAQLAAYLYRRSPS